MRANRSVVLLLAVATIATATSVAETTRPHARCDAVTADGFGGGEPPERPHARHLSDEQRRRIEDEIRDNVARLRAEGRLAQPRGSHPQLDWPLRAANGLNDYEFHGVSNFVDHDPAYPGALLDFTCGDRTYDLSGGYNHRGVDIFTWPFPWQRMDNDEVEVVAAAAGTIVARADGNFDRSCSINNNSWNAMYVMHADGSMVWYGHLKNGSLTTKPVGETVTSGEYLGVVGSSGSSSGPHLHLEVYDASGTPNDPFQGACNSMNGESWWVSQRPYYDSGINKLTTGHAPPDFAVCPQPEHPNAATVFDPGDTVFFTTYYRDQLSSQQSVYTILRPDGSIWNTWTHNISAAHYSASYWYWYWNSFAPEGPEGIWRFRVEFESATHELPFVLGAPPGAGEVPGEPGFSGPLTVERVAPDRVALNWSASCVASDDDYAVYEGPVGGYGSQTPRMCSTGGQTSADLTPIWPSSYFLVVPRNVVQEGSYGRDGDGIERPAAADGCVPQQIVGCYQSK